MYTPLRQKAPESVQNTLCACTVKAFESFSASIAVPPMGKHRENPGAPVLWCAVSHPLLILPFFQTVDVMSLPCNPTQDTGSQKMAGKERKKPRSQPGAGPIVSALLMVSQVSTSSELANRGCACAWSKDKRAQRHSLSQGPLIRQTVEMPPWSAQLPKVCKPEGGCSPVCSPCSYRAHLRHSQGCSLPSLGILSASQRLLQGVGGWADRAVCLDDAFNRATRHWASKSSYHTNYLNHPVCKPLLQHLVQIRAYQQE